MRVRCDQCGTSYQLDLPPAALASGRRQKFRCTRCGHRFVVVRADGSLTEAIVTGPAPPKQPPAPKVAAEGPTALVSDPESLHGQVTVDLSAALRTEPPSQADARETTPEDGEVLYLRQAGELYRVEDHVTLQRWVLEQRALPTDELSTGQDDWTPLSEIAALAPLFRSLKADAPPLLPRTPGVPSGAAGDLTRAGAQAAAATAATRPGPDLRDEVADALTEEARPEPETPSPGAGFLPGPGRDSLTDLLLSLEGASAEEVPEPANLKRAPNPTLPGASPGSEADETEEADLAEVLAMLLEGEEGAAEREANAIRHPSIPPDATEEAPATEDDDAGPPTEQLPDDIASLLTGLQSPGSAPQTATEDDPADGPAPELQQALDVLPPDISALVSGLAEDDETEEAPRNEDLAGISWTNADDTETELPPPPSPFADEPFLEMPTEIGDVPYFDEDEDEEPRTDTTSRWIFLGAILVFAVGIGAMFLGSGPETPALGSGAGAPAAGDTPSTPDGATTGLQGGETAATADAPPSEGAAAQADAAESAKAAASETAKAKAEEQEAAKANSPAKQKKPAASRPRSTDVRALLSRGWSDVDNGEWSDAREIFARAARVSPENGQVHYGLGYIAEKQGNPREAYREYCIAWTFSTGDIELRREISGRLNVLNRSCD